MDPISTMAFAAALATQMVPTRKPSFYEGAMTMKSFEIDTTHNAFMKRGMGGWTSSLDRPMVVTIKAVTQELIAPVATLQYPIDRRDALKNEIKSYSFLTNGWDGSDSFAPSRNSILRAETFIERLPAGLPLPTPMISSNGEIGFYWDAGYAYADIQLEDGELMSLYTRKRLGDEEETFEDNVADSEITDNWFSNNLNLLIAA